MIKKCYCPDCGKLLSSCRHKKCKSCFQKSKKCSLKTRIKMSLAHIGKHQLQKTKRKISKTLTGRKHPRVTKARKGRTLLELGHKPNCPCCICKTRRGERKPFYRKVKYKKTVLRSYYELSFAQWLTLSGYKWEYEPKRFNLGKTTYTPDFYLLKFNLYVEIKGWARTIFKKKIKLFKKLYPNINYKILYKKDLEGLGIIL